MVVDETFNFLSDELDCRAVDADGSMRTFHKRKLNSYSRAIYEKCDQPCVPWGALALRWSAAVLRLQKKSPRGAGFLSACSALIWPPAQTLDWAVREVSALPRRRALVAAPAPAGSVPPA